MTIFLAAISVVATVIFGVIPLYKKFRYPAKITFVKESTINLFDSIVKNLQDLKMTYKENPVSQDLVLIKGAILNSGSKDITKTMIEQPLELNIPTGYKWLTAKIISTAKNVKAGATIKNDQTITFELGLFRCKEYIHFEALAECPAETSKTKPYPDRKNIEEAMVFIHRIADTDKVDSKRILPETKPKKRISYVLFPIAVVVLVTTMLFFSKEMFLQLSYAYKVDTGKTIEVMVSPKSNGTFLIKGISERYSKVVTPDEFFKQCDAKPEIIIDRKSKHMFIFLSIIYILLPIGMYCRTYFKSSQNKKLKRMLSMEE